MQSTYVSYTEGWMDNRQADRYRKTSMAPSESSNPISTDLPTRLVFLTTPNLGIEEKKMLFA